jgi:hypothetical protein
MHSRQLHEAADTARCLPGASASAVTPARKPHVPGLLALPQPVRLRDRLARSRSRPATAERPLRSG